MRDKDRRGEEEMQTERETARHREKERISDKDREIDFPIYGQGSPLSSLTQRGLFVPPPHWAIGFISYHEWAHVIAVCLWLVVFSVAFPKQTHKASAWHGESPPAALCQYL